jgi:hypothetical protein
MPVVYRMPGGAGQNEISEFCDAGDKMLHASMANPRSSSSKTPASVLPPGVSAHGIFPSQEACTFKL